MAINKNSIVFYSVYRIEAQYADVFDLQNFEIAKRHQWHTSYVLHIQTITSPLYQELLG